MSSDDRFAVFFVVWVTLAIANGIFLWRGSPTAKRTWFPRLVVLAGILFVAFTYWMAPEPHILVLLIPATALITFLNLRFTKICQDCGAYNGLFHTKLCRKCGAELS